MAKQYRIPPGTVYPATAAGYRKAKAGKLDEVDWTKPNEEELVIQPPYPEIVSSWLANGIVEAAEETILRLPKTGRATDEIPFVPRPFKKGIATGAGEEVND